MYIYTYIYIDIYIYICICICTVAYLGGGAFDDGPPPLWTLKICF